ncbi:TIGR00255 family protein [Persephonella hydrogeniphila]|uniref:TIGR00255 family protein n=1 Tax=Persephonella hydrogeniphila TaxID=198703 RepID=A0A285NGB0_9AQUI|nr:YicC/YloC family endoribonuclease [Persephonella hydrogeniphila]SNZ08489.1 TIGR00255 family protein [Persephonella hydrogeniphila]
MPYSMTGFGYSVKSFDEYEIEVRIKSLNHKGIDISVKGPRDIVFFIDLDIRNTIKSFFERGSFQVYINIRYTRPKQLLNIENLKKALESAKDMLNQLGLNVTDDKMYEITSSLASEFEEETVDEQLKKRVLEAVKEACENLKEERKKEGEKLVKDIKERINSIQENLEKIKAQKDKIIEKAKQRITEKVKELLGEEYSERAFIEATLLAEKMDITEEVVRLESHIQRFKELLKQDKPVGRKMDFMCQEMHREINTMGNKMPDFSPYTVEMKTQLEKIRQQVQNIE